MFPLAVEMVLLLAIALVLGFVLGMLLRRLLSKSNEVKENKYKIEEFERARSQVASRKSAPTIPSPPMPRVSADPENKTVESSSPVASGGSSKSQLAAKKSTKRSRTAKKPALGKKPASDIGAPKNSRRKPNTVPESDNLKLIRGIGPKNEKKLNDTGVYSFSQIAGWSKKEQSRIGELLSFSGRIEREEWVSQAKALVRSR